MNLVLLVALTSLSASQAFSSTPSSQSVALPSASFNPNAAHQVTTAQESEDSFASSIKKSLGITYFTFFYGPGLHPDALAYSPNQLGEAEKHGLYLQNNVSFRYKYSSNIALDFQTRFNIFLTDYRKRDNFSVFVWESPRIGISGKLFHGDDWSITGAFNTDFPYFFPEPFSGFEVQQRTVLLNPGLFANFSWEPKGSRWSVFSVLAPRMFFYKDRSAAEENYILGGYNPQNKPELVIQLQPTINYRIDTSLELSFGAKVDYRKHVLSAWNPLNADLASNGTNPAWRLAPMSVFLGMTYKASPAFAIFPFIATYPIGAQRLDAQTGRQATLLQATSIGMWLRGTLF